MTHRLSGFPGGKAGKGGKQVAERAFHELLAGHLDAGTRPGLKPGAVGGKWTAVAFAKAVRVSDRTVRNWRTTGKGTLPNAETLEFILDALFGDDTGLRAERLELLDAWDRAALADAEPERDGAIFVEGEERLELQQGTADDDAVARQPGIARRQALIVEKLQDLVEALGNRLDNQRGWRPLPRTAQRLLAALENLPPEEIPAQLVELYDRTMSLASFVDQDDALSLAKGATDDPLEPDLRRALADALSSLGPWLRSFPSVVQWDSARQDALTRPELFAAVRAQLDDARAFIRLASDAHANEPPALSPKDVALAIAPLETAGSQGFQAEKAAYRGLATARNLLTRAVGIRALTTESSPGDCSLNITTESTLAHAVDMFLARADKQALRLAEHMPSDVAAAIRHVLTRRTGGERTGERASGRAAAERRQPPDDFDLYEVERLILAGAAPPAEWVPFIVELRLKDRKVHDLSPLSGLSSLRMLFLGRTQVADVLPLFGLSSLQRLDLSGTNVADASPLSGLASLQTLHLTGTPVADVSPLSGLSSLLSLDLNLTQVADVSALSGLSGLRSLDLTSTRVADVSPLSGLSSLQTLRLQLTRVTDVSPLSGLSTLLSLDLNLTAVADVTPLSGLSSLQKLYLSGTRVADVSQLAGLSSLQWLGLRDTQVVDVSPLSGLSRLQWLDLRGTQVVDVSPLAGLSSLVSLDLTGTQIADVSPLSGLSSLISLDLRDTRVTDVSPLSGLSSVRTLYMVNTQIADVSPLSGLSSLTLLDLSGTKVMDVSPLSGLFGLQSLYLMGTPIADVSPLSDLSSLEALYLINTPVADVSSLSGLASLQSLDLSGTRVADVAPLAGLSNLQSLYLVSTRVADVSPLSGLSNLQRLDLTGTQVADVSPLSALSGLTIVAEGREFRAPFADFPKRRGRSKAGKAPKGE